MQGTHTGRPVFFAKQNMGKCENLPLRKTFLHSALKKLAIFIVLWYNTYNKMQWLHKKIKTKLKGQKP